ncbi:MAG: ABC transporter substrate-binding protein [Methanobacterium sp.]|nr:ABC transporter substrate-binding protein [Methanobacterium sp.]
MNKLFLTFIFIFAFLLVIFSGYYYSQSANTPQDITVAYLSSDHEAAFMVAQAQDTYKKAGLNVKSVQMSTGSDIVSAAASGDIDVGYVGIAPALQGISNGVPIKIVGAVNLDGSGIVVGEDSNITSIPDLKGKKVASPGVSSIQQVLLLYELQKYNMTAKDLDILSVNIFIIPNTLAAHKVDAYIAYEPYVSLSPYRSIGKVLMYSNDIIPGHPCCVIIARQDYINQNPQELQKFLDIHKNTTEYINSHRNETAYLISKEMTTNPSLEEIALTHVVFVSQLDNEFQAKVMDFIKIEQELGFLKKNLTPEQIFDTRFLGG